MDKTQLKHDPVAESIVHLIGRLKANRRSIMLYGGIIAIVIIGTTFYLKNKKEYPQKASYALASARSPEELKNVVKDYKDNNVAAPAALCQLGYIAAQNTNFAEAVEYYRTIINNYPDSLLTPAAILAVAKCYVAQGKYTEAESVLKREVLYDKNNYIAVVAQIELVQILCSMGRYNEAIEQLQIWNQMGGNTYFSYLSDGLQEKLLRVTGLSTNLISQQANENPNQ